MAATSTSLVAMDATASKEKTRSEQRPTPNQRLRVLSRHAACALNSGAPNYATNPLVSLQVAEGGALEKQAREEVTPIVNLLNVTGLARPPQPPTHPELVPTGYAEALREDPDALWLLKWFTRKDELRQDTFVLGPPGPERRRMVLAWCEITGKEVEYVALSPDTTESDLKQRREIRGNGKSVEWQDQAPVRAAVFGRILILEGVEKAERNVLPTLNNILENREIALQDGRFLTAPLRFDGLGPELREKANLVRVSDNFRVIALGLPVPPFPGFPLDPPLRSRFVARTLDPRPTRRELRRLSSRFPEVDIQLVNRFLGFAEATWKVFAEEEEEAIGRGSKGGGMFHCSNLAVFGACATLERFPAESPGRALRRFYPHFLMDSAGRKALDSVLVERGLETGEELEAKKNVDDGGHSVWTKSGYQLVETVAAGSLSHGHADSGDAARPLTMVQRFVPTQWASASKGATAVQMPVVWLGSGTTNRRFAPTPTPVVESRVQAGQIIRTPGLNRLLTELLQDLVQKTRWDCNAGFTAVSLFWKSWSDGLQTAVVRVRRRTVSRPWSHRVRTTIARVTDCVAQVTQTAVCVDHVTTACNLCEWFSVFSIQNCAGCTGSFSCHRPPGR